MVKINFIKKIFIITLILFTTTVTAKGFSAFVGAGTNFSGIGSFRVGYGDWEIGRFSSFSFGVNKVFKTSAKTYYTFGFGIDNHTTPSILAGAGFNLFKFLGFGFRGELYSVSSIKGNLNGAATLGASWNF